MGWAASSPTPSTALGPGATLIVFAWSTLPVGVRVGLLNPLIRVGLCWNFFAFVCHLPKLPCPNFVLLLLFALVSCYRQLFFMIIRNIFLLESPPPPPSLFISFRLYFLASSLSEVVSFLPSLFSLTDFYRFLAFSFFKLGLESTRNILLYRASPSVFMSTDQFGNSQEEVDLSSIGQRAQPPVHDSPIAESVPGKDDQIPGRERSEVPPTLHASEAVSELEPGKEPSGYVSDDADTSLVDATIEAISKVNIADNPVSPLVQPQLAPAATHDAFVQIPEAPEVKEEIEGRAEGEPAASARQQPTSVEFNGPPSVHERTESRTSDSGLSHEALSFVPESRTPQTSHQSQDPSGAPVDGRRASQSSRNSAGSTRDRGPSTHSRRSSVGSHGSIVDHTAPDHTVGVYRADLEFSMLIRDEALLKAIYSMGFSNPSKIQADALPKMLDGEHVIGQAQHGSGKTAAFSLAMLSRVDPAAHYPQAIVICPTRELAIQVADVFDQLSKFTEIKTFRAVKDPNIRGPRGQVQEQIIVGTPGTVLNQIKFRNFNVRLVKIFCFDEADIMVVSSQQPSSSPGGPPQQGGYGGQGGGFGARRNDSLGDQAMRIRSYMPRDCQILLFSATFPQTVRSFAMKAAPNATRIVIKKEKLRVDSIRQILVECKNLDDKYEALTTLYGLLENIGQSIVFVETVANAKDLANRMRADGYAVSVLFGRGMDVQERDRVMRDFRENRSTVLITTNVLSRGIDVETVTLVVNYDVPQVRSEEYGVFSNKPDCPTYMHRIGRSGRFGRKGIALNLADNPEAAKQFQFISEYYDIMMHRFSSEQFEEIENCVHRHILGQQ
eukprot:819765_1